MPKIIFTDIDNPEGTLPKPKPATEYVPQWYKDANAYIGGKKKPSMDGSSVSTIKRCMPLWDMMTAGYIIETPYDIYIRQTPEGPYFQWGEMRAIAFQAMEQFQNHPYSRDINYAVRIVHPWSIQTPKGWSVMIMEPQHHELGPIEVSSGIVDTDKYINPFNMFLKLRDPNFEGLIPAGTPFAQVIPFKRDNWKSALGGEEQRNKTKMIERILGIQFFDKYKNHWWQRKEYK
jgi:hypothetical protein